MAPSRTVMLELNVGLPVAHVRVRQTTRDIGLRPHLQVPA